MHIAHDIECRENIKFSHNLCDRRIRTMVTTRMYVYKAVYKYQKFI